MLRVYMRIRGKNANSGKTHTYICLCTCIRACAGARMLAVDIFDKRMIRFKTRSVVIRKAWRTVLDKIPGNRIFLSPFETLCVIVVRLGLDGCTFDILSMSIDHAPCSILLRIHKRERNIRRIYSDDTQVASKGYQSRFCGRSFNLQTPQDWFLTCDCTRLLVTTR